MSSTSALNGIVGPTSSFADEAGIVMSTLRTAITKLVEATPNGARKSQDLQKLFGICGFPHGGDLIVQDILGLRRDGRRRRGNRGWGNRFRSRLGDDSGFRFFGLRRRIQHSRLLFFHRIVKGEIGFVFF